MNELISKLTGDQALEVLGRLVAGDSRMSRMIEAEALLVLAAVNVDEVAEAVYEALDNIAVTECWDRAGSHRNGYTSPEEAAVELIEEELQPFVDQAQRHHELGMTDQERDTCMGIILGLYCFDKKSKTEFKNWCIDLPRDSAECILMEWRERNSDGAARDMMDNFVREQCLEWARL